MNFPDKALKNSSKKEDVPIRKMVHNLNASSRSGQNAALAQYARQFLLPVDVGGAKPLSVSPSNYPSQVCVRHIHKVVDVSSATHAGGFSTIMNPNLMAPGFVSNSGAVTMPPAGPGPVALSCQGVSYDPVLPTFTYMPGIKVMDSVSEQIFTTTPIADSALDLKSGLVMTPSAASNGTFSVLNTGPDLCKFEIWYKVALGAWTIISTNTLASGQDKTTTFLIPLNANSLGFSFASGSKSSRISLKIAIDAKQFSALAVDSIGPAFDRFILDNELSMGRVISMSILATNTSPDLANGGTINAGRVPRSFHPFTQIAANLAALPENRRWQGPASTGAYVTWMPSQFDEYEIDNLASKQLQLSEAEYLIVNVQGWNPPAGATSSFRLQFDWIVEFYTPNQLFEKVLTPPMSREFEVLFHILLSMPAATCNPGHVDALRNLVRKGVEYGKGAYRFYNDHRVIIDGIVAALLSV